MASPNPRYAVAGPLQYLPGSQIALNSAHWAIQRMGPGGHFWSCANGYPRDLLTGQIWNNQGNLIVPVPTVAGVMMNCESSGWAEIGGKAVAGHSQFSILALAKNSVTTSVSSYPFYCERAASGNDIVKLEMAGSNLGAASVMGTLRNDGGTLLQWHGSVALNDGKPHVVAWTQNGTVSGGARLFSDGKFEASATWSTNFTMTNSIVARIGGDAGDSGAHFLGDIGFVAVWPDVAFTDSEISDLSMNWRAMLRSVAPRRHATPVATIGSGGANFLFAA
jgi:hypothetical protein